MNRLLKLLLFYQKLFFKLNPLAFKDYKDEKNFIEWLLPYRQSQVAAISALTACLYLTNGVINYFIESGQALRLMLISHFFILPPTLFLVSVFAFWGKKPKLTMFFLSLAPVIALSNSYYILTHFETLTPHLVETYLGLLWIFVVSGLTMARAVVSALASFTVVITGTLCCLGFNNQELIYHFFWIFCSISFGLLGGFLIERSTRAEYLNRLELEKLAVTDRLTGLANRIRFHEILSRELDRSCHFKHQLCILVIDIDFFKKINDTWGHQVGDKILKDISHILIEGSRSTDLVFRWGGEEFIIIAPETNQKEGKELAERLRSNVQKTVFQDIGQKTISIGLTQSKEKDNPESIVKRADLALYKAKNEGRNKVVVG